ncbi:hypothetical protein AHF37_10560 [Paragonimus kellicotti]|nr:hypothetical protein AHF37_10560 [Paragonimus kellicotti]
MLESELKENHARVEAVFQNAHNTVAQHPQLADPLQVRLDELSSRWNGLQSLMQTRLEKMMKLHRGKKLAYCISSVHRA